MLRAEPGKTVHMPNPSRVKTQVNAAFAVLRDYVSKDLAHATAELIDDMPFFELSGSVAATYAQRFAMTLRRAGFSTDGLRSHMTTDRAGQTKIRAGVLTNSLQGLTALTNWLERNLLRSLASQVIMQSDDLAFVREWQLCLKEVRRIGTVQEKTAKKKRLEKKKVQFSSFDELMTAVKPVGAFIAYVQDQTLSWISEPLSSPLFVYQSLCLIFCGGGAFPLRSGFAGESSIGRTADANVQLLGKGGLRVRVGSDHKQKHHEVPSLFLTGSMKKRIIDLAAAPGVQGTKSPPFVVRQLWHTVMADVAVPRLLIDGQTTLAEPRIMRRAYSTVMQFLLCRGLISAKEFASVAFMMAHTASIAMSDYNAVPAMWEILDVHNERRNAALRAYEELTTVEAGPNRTKVVRSRLVSKAEVRAKSAWHKLSIFIRNAQRGHVAQCEWCEKDISKRTSDWHAHKCYAEEISAHECQ
mgnify:CR=1 FL=1